MSPSGAGAGWPRQLCSTCVHSETRAEGAAAALEESSSYGSGKLLESTPDQQVSAFQNFHRASSVNILLAKTRANAKPTGREYPPLLQVKEERVNISKR